jgi:hypothetical protein
LMFFLPLWPKRNTLVLQRAKMAFAKKQNASAARKPRSHLFFDRGP